ALLARPDLLEHSERRADRAERVAELVAQHRDELVLRAAVRFRVGSSNLAPRDLGQIRDEQAQALDPGPHQLVHGEADRDAGAPGRHEMAGMLASPDAQQRGERQTVVFADVTGDRAAADLLDGRVHQLREPTVAVEDVAGRRQRERRLLHLLDQHAIRPVGAFERIDLFGGAAAGTLDHQRVHLSRADRVQQLFRLLEAAARLLDVERLRHPVAPQTRVEPPLGSPRPWSTRASSDRSPMIRRTGNGNCLTRVGAAMICWALAAAGCWYRSTTSSS